MNLSELQSAFTHSIVKESPSINFLSELKPGGTIASAHEAFKVYQNGYPARLFEALGETYEAVWRVLGDDDFITTCKDYIKANPSQSYNLNDYGAQFSQFLKSSAHSKDLPFLSELALFEWSFHSLFHKSPDIPINFTPEQISKINDSTNFTFLSTLQMHDFQAPIYSIWKLRKEESFEPLDFETPEKIIMFKCNSQFIRIISLNPVQFFILSNLKSSKTLSVTLDRATEYYTINDQVVAELFQLLMGNQLVTTIEGISE